MTQEEKQLLLVDLCARLPYGVKFAITNKKTDTLKSIGITKYGLIPINLFYKKPLFYLINEFGNIEYKPYLRPMSNMTEEEKEKYIIIKQGECNGCVLTGKGDPNTEFLLVDFFNSHYFDYRGLIPMGLALEASKGMYNIN